MRLWTIALAAALLAGCAGQEEKNAARLTIFEQADDSMPRQTWTTIEVKSAGLKIPIQRFPALTDFDIASVKLTPTAGGAAILVQYDPTGMMKLLELTTRCRSRYLVIFLNDKPVAAWLCDKILNQGQLLVEGDFTDEEAQQAVDSLNKAAKKRAAP